MWRSAEAVPDAFVMLLIGKLVEFQCSKHLYRCIEKAWKAGAVPSECDSMVYVAADGTVGSDSGTFLTVRGTFISVGLLP